MKLALISRFACALFTACAPAGAAFADVEWNLAECFNDLSFTRCRGTLANGVLVMTDIERDAYFTLYNVQVDPTGLDTLEFKYRATGIGKSGGQFYYCHEGAGDSDLRRWNLPPLVADGEWHVATITDKALVNSGSWYGGGFIRKLRLDPMDPAGGRVELAWLRLKASKPAAPVAAQPSTTTQKLPPGFRYGETPWPAVRRVWAEDRGTPTATVRGPYFTGAAITAPADVGTGGTFTLARKFALKAAPVQAWLQCFGDETAKFFLNGRYALQAHYVPKAAYLARTAQECVVELLKKGTNELSVTYTTSSGRTGAALAELFVRYADGSYERICTDETFRDAAGKAAICNPPPPASPWSVVLKYCDYARPQRGLGGGPDSDTIVAGGETMLRYAFDGIPPEGVFEATVTLRRGKFNAGRERLALNARDHVVPRANGTWELAVPFVAPLYCGGGDYELLLESGAFPVIGGILAPAKIKILQPAAIPGFAHPPVAQVKMLNGGPELHIDGKPTMLFWGAPQLAKRVDNKATLGRLSVNAITVYNDSREWHPRMGVWDATAFDRQAELYRRAQKDAWFIWDLTICPPRDWEAANPDDMCRDERGVVAKDGGRVNFSFASKRAIDEMKGTVAWAIRYLEKSPYANRIIGYRINSGHTIEWLGWRPEPGHIFDFSKAAQEKFKAFAAAFYPALTDTSVPGPAARRALDDGSIIWDPGRHLASIAFVDFNSRNSAEDVLAMCGCAKETLAALGRDKIVGTYYGYTATLNANGASQMRAHYALETLLAGPHVVDYIMSPQNYGQRNLGDTCGEMKPFATLAANGILPVIEDDTRTHNCSWGEMHGYCQSPTVRASRETMRRNLSIALCRREPVYCYALCYGREFDFPGMAEDGRAIRTVGEHCLAKGTRRKAEVAVVVSEKAIVSSPMCSRYVPAGAVTQDYDIHGEPIVRLKRSALLEGDLYNDNYSRFACAGVPFDLVLAEDLARHPGDYRAYVFENCFVRTPALQDAVDRLRQRACTLVWLYAPGYQDGLGLSLEGMKALTGFTFGRFPAPAPAQVKFADGRLMGIPDELVAPLFFVKDAEETLARYADGSAGVAMRRTGRATSLYSGAWRLDVSFARDTFKRAGVHVWCDSGDPVEANERLFTLHAREPGVKTVRLPRKTDVLDVFGRRIVARGAESFMFSAPLHTSHLFYYGDDAEELLARLED